MLKRYDIVKEIYSDGSLSKELYIIYSVAPNGYVNMLELGKTADVGIPDGENNLLYVRDGTKEELIATAENNSMPVEHFLSYQERCFNIRMSNDIHSANDHIKKIKITSKFASYLDGLTSPFVEKPKEPPKDAIVGQFTSVHMEIDDTIEDEYYEIVYEKN